MTANEPNYRRRFGGIARLYGNEALEALTRAHVCVLGVGGVGSWAVEALARSGVGRLTLVDMDHVAESNTNRQLQALESELGKAKVQVLAERIAGINPSADVICKEEFASPDNFSDLIGDDLDWVMDCIDSYRVKAALIAHCRRRRLRCITLGGAGGQTDPGLIRVGDLARTEHDPLLSRTRRLLRAAYGFSREPKRAFGIPAVYSTEQARPPRTGDGCSVGEPAPVTGLNCAGFGSVMHVTASFGLVAAGYVVNRLVIPAPSQGS